MMMRSALIAGLLVASAHATERIDEFAQRASITFLPGEAIYEVELPLSVHQGARRADLGDLRVFNGAGEVVPHALRTLKLEAKEEPLIDAKIFPYRASLDPAALQARPDLKLELRPGGAVVMNLQSAVGAAPADASIRAYFLDLGAAEKPSFKALKLDWEPVATSFSGRVDLHASDDLRAWRALATAAPLLDLQRSEERLQLSRIEFPPARARYLRLTWHGTQPVPALRSAGVEPASMQPQHVRRTTTHVSRHGEKEGEYLVDLGAALAVRAVQIDLPQQNTVSAIALSARAHPSDAWHRVERATFYRLLHAGQEWRNPERQVRAAPARYWQLSVDSRGGGLGGGLPKLVVTWEPRVLVFVARGDGPFTLAFGHGKYAPADFRVESLIPGLAEGKPVAVSAATLGDIEAVRAAQPSGRMDELIASLSEERGRRWLLWSILVGGVAILGLLAWRMARNPGDNGRRN